EPDEMENVSESRKEMTEKMKEIWKEVREFNDRIRQNGEIVANQTKEKHSFKEGDLVWLYTKQRKKGLSPKLTHPWHGPFRIIQLTSPVNVRLQNLNRRKLKQVVHVGRLKKYFEPKRPVEDIEVEEEDRFDWEIEEMEEKKELEKKKKEAK